MKFGRLFRKMGLPAWTFIGVGVSALFFQYLGSLLEGVMRAGIGTRADASPWLTLVPPGSILVGLVLTVLILNFSVNRSMRRSAGPSSPLLSQPDGKKGLIVLVSTPASAMHAINYHLSKATLQRVWLIPSDNTAAASFGDGSLSTADEIKGQCTDLKTPDGRSLDVTVVERGVSAADAQDTYDAVNSIFRTGGLAPAEVIADFTGGTKPMAVGMIMACLPVDRELEYVAFHPQQRVMSGPYVVDYQHSAFDLVG